MTNSGMLEKNSIMAAKMYKDPGTICLDYLNGLLDTTTSSSSRWKDGVGLDACAPLPVDNTTDTT